MREAKPLSPDVIDQRIKEGNRRRRVAKQGTWKRLFGNCKKFVVGSVLLALAAAGSVGSFSRHFYGTDRPDLLEVFAGAAEISLRFSRRGWCVSEPVDIDYGCDLRDQGNREEFLKMIDDQRPRLVVVEYPCTWWSALSETNYRTPQQRRRLAKLRKRDEPFLKLTEDIFDKQIARDDDAPGENPLLSRSFRTPIMKRVLAHPKVHAVVGHGCRFNMRNPYNNLLMKKPTMWFSTSIEICDELGKKCPNTFHHKFHEHGQCQGGRTTKVAARYSPEIAAAVHKGFVATIRRKDPSRLRGLLKGIAKRLRKGDQDSRDLKWNKDVVDRLLRQWESQAHPVMAVSSAAQGEPVGAGAEQVSVHLAGDGIVFEVPHGKKVDEVTRGLLKKIHCNLGHPSVSDLKRFLKRGGAGDDLLQAVDFMKCTSCARSQRPRLHRTTRMPPHDLQFNDQVYIDCFHVRDDAKQGDWFMSILDRATMYHQVTYLKNHTPETFRAGLFDYWIRWAGVPEEVTVDMERGLVSQSFTSALSEAGIQVVPIAGQAHWQNGKIERHGSILKDT